jgi:hypothetical protein
MDKAVLISIKPKWCELIASGKKTIMVRKTRPKLETPFKCYIYCTTVKSMNLQDYCELHAKTGGAVDDWQGKVIGEFVCNRVHEIEEPFLTWLEENSCVDMNDIAKYKGEKEYIYGWGLSDLLIYDKPPELSVFSSGSSRLEFSDTPTGFPWRWSGMTRPPQSWCYVKGENND